MKKGGQQLKHTIIASKIFFKHTQSYMDVLQNYLVKFAFASTVYPTG